MIVKRFTLYTQRFTMKADLSLNCAVLCLFGYELQSFEFPDFRRLAAKKADASSKNSFNSLSRLIFLSRSFSCLLSSLFSSTSVNAVPGICSPFPRSTSPFLALCTYVPKVFFGTPSSSDALFVPTYFASFIACALNSSVYVLACPISETVIFFIGNTAQSTCKPMKNKV